MQEDEESPSLVAVVAPLDGIVCGYDFVSSLFSAALRVEVGSAVRVALTGGLDIVTVCAVDRLLRCAHAALIILDLRGLSFMDCAGLRMVVDADARLSEAGGRLVIVHGPSQVRRVFEFTGMSERLEMVSDPGATLHAARGGAAGEAPTEWVGIDAC